MFGRINVREPSEQQMDRDQPAVRQRPQNVPKITPSNALLAQPVLRHGPDHATQLHHQAAVSRTLQRMAQIITRTARQTQQPAYTTLEGLQLPTVGQMARSASQMQRQTPQMASQMEQWSPIWQIPQVNTNLPKNDILH